MVSDETLRRLPKAHLHLHLTGGMRRATLRALAADRGVQLPERLVEEFPDEWKVLGWPKFQRLYDVARGVLRTAEDIQRILLERAKDEAADGSRWLELQVTPTGYVSRFGDVVTATEVFCLAAAEAERATGVGIRLVIAANRTRPPWEAETLARIAVRMSSYGVVGFGLSNDERVAAPGEFAKAFRIARDGGLIAVPHAGEMLGPASVEQTVRALHPRRLGHGVRAAEDPRVLDLLAERGIACEVCPGSNVALGVFAGHEAVPIRELERAGVPVVLAADDPLLFGAGLIEQYAAVRDVHGYDADDLARLAAASVTHSTMPADLRGRMLADIEAWRAALASGN